MAKKNDGLISALTRQLKEKQRDLSEDAEGEILEAQDDIRILREKIAKKQEDLQELHILLSSTGVNWLVYLLHFLPFALALDGFICIYSKYISMIILILFIFKK